MDISKLVDMAEKSDNPQRLINNALLAERLESFNKLGFTHGGDRDTYEVLGYPQNKDLEIEDYWKMYYRHPIAKVIVKAPVNATWRRPPDIKERDSEEGEETEFSKAIQDLNDNVKLWQKIERADRLSGIGRFGVMVIGVKGEPNVRAELPRLSSVDDIAYFSVYGEGTAKIKEADLVSDKGNPRFGKPEFYRIDMGDGHEKVHWSRVIHLAEGLDEDEVFGTPRIMAAYNACLDIIKTVGGSAEMFWQSGRGGINVKADPEATLSEEDKEELDNRAAAYTHGLTRVFQTEGVSIERIPGEVSEPNSIFSALISLVSAVTRIPKRILIGSERGRLASITDDASWNGHIRSRQNKYVAPQIIEQTVDRLIDYGAIREPGSGYEIVWPNLFELDELEKAEMYKDRAEALNKITGGFPREMFGIGEIREFMGFDPELPDDFVKQLMEQAEELDEADEDVKRQFARVAGNGSYPAHSH